MDAGWTFTTLAARLALAAPQGWSGAGHPGVDWTALLGRVGGFAFLALLVLLVMRAFALRNRYRGVRVLGEPERAELRAAIGAAERRTSGELVVVVLERSDRHPAAEWIAAAAVALVGSAAFAAALPWDRPALLLLCQLALGAAGFLAARLLPDFKRRFVSPWRATEMADEQAAQEFFRHGLHRTADGTGVLLFVSLFEHRVVVLGDAGVDAAVPAGYWEAVKDAVLDGVRAGSLKDGLLEALRRTAAVLEERFPRAADDRDELPDHVEVRRE